MWDSPPQWGFGGPYGRAVQSAPIFQVGRQRPGAVQRPAQGAGSQGLGPRRPRLPADPPPWLPQLHHACTGPGLSLLCLLRHDILEYFSVYGTALSMWVSLMGEWPPPAAQPCTWGSGCPTARRPPRPAADSPPLRSPVRKHMQGVNASTPGESQGWWSLVGCRLWGRAESDTTEAS